MTTASRQGFLWSFLCFQRALREVGLSSVEELKEAVTKLSCSIQKLQDRISREDDECNKPVSQFVLHCAPVKQRAKVVMVKVVVVLVIFRSTSKSRPNNIRG